MEEVNLDQSIDLIIKIEDILINTEIDIMKIGTAIIDQDLEINMKKEIIMKEKEKEVATIKIDTILDTEKKDTITEKEIAGITEKEILEIENIEKEILEDLIKAQERDIECQDLILKEEIMKILSKNSKFQSSLQTI